MRGSFLAGLYRAALALVAVVGVVLNIRENSLGESLVFFTVQSNVLLAVVAACSAWASFAGRAPLPGWLKGGAALYISITGLVFNFVLADMPPESLGGSATPGPAMELATWLLHTVTPLLAVLDWLIFERHRRLRWRHAAYWLSYPLTYFVFALVRGELIDAPVRYPYPFINVDMIGVSGVATNVVIYASAFWVLGMVLVLVDRLLPRSGERSRTDEPIVRTGTGS